MTFWVAGAAVVGGIASSAISSSAAGNAAQLQAQGAQNAQNISERQFNLINAQEQPFLQAGQGATSQLNNLLGIGGPPGASSSGVPGGATPTGGYGSLLAPFTADTFKQYSPAYQFQQQQGMQGVLNSDASGQGALSGAANKDLIDYNQGLAGTSFNNAFNQYQTQQGNIYSRLAGIANMGQSAASQTAQSGTTLAGQASESATDIGSAQAGGAIGSGNAWSGGVSSLGGILASYGGGGQQGINSNYSGAFSANTGGTAGSSYDYLYSDRRLKKNIRRIGVTQGGQPWYEFEYIGRLGLHTGVMADESPVDAVTYDADGFAMVDYSRIR